MLRLVEIRFIQAKADGNREFGQVLLLNPPAMRSRLQQESKVPDEWWMSFARRTSEIGAAIPAPLDATAKAPEPEPKVYGEGSE